MLQLRGFSGTRDKVGLEAVGWICVRQTLIQNKVFIFRDQYTVDVFKAF
jgi:hypothetical protein